jgi:hypothetical protein
VPCAELGEEGGVAAHPLGLTAHEGQSPRGHTGRQARQAERGMRGTH